MSLTHVASPAGSAAGGASNAVGYGVLARKHADADHTVPGDDVAGEELAVFGHVGGEHGQEFLYVLNEIRIKVGHYTAETVVVEGHAGSACLLHDVENLLAHAKRIEQHRGGAEVHAERTHEETVGSDTRELIHKNTDDTRALGHLDTGGLLDA